MGLSRWFPVNAFDVCVNACLEDEGALVRAARNLGFVFTGRTPNSVIVEAVSDPQLLQWGIDTLMFH